MLEKQQTAPLNSRQKRKRAQRTWSLIIALLLVCGLTLYGFPRVYVPIRGENVASSLLAAPPDSRLVARTESQVPGYTTIQEIYITDKTLREIREWFSSYTSMTPLGQFTGTETHIHSIASSTIANGSNEYLLLMLLANMAHSYYEYEMMPTCFFVEATHDAAEVAHVLEREPASNESVLITINYCYPNIE